MSSTDISRLVLSALPILIAITFHELSHGFVANRLGDPTAKMLGRLTLNPLAHIDLFGTILLPLMLIVLHAPFVFGYAKPVPINPMNFRNPRKGMAISAAAGPITNIIIALISGIILRIMIPFSAFLPSALAEKVIAPLAIIFAYSVLINIVLAAFNMIPFPPLDGGRVLVGLLPSRQAISFSRIEPFGFIIVLLLMYTHIAGIFINPLITGFIQLFHLGFIFDLLQMY